MAHLSGGVVALLDTLTFPETITILVIALIVLGPEKLPGMARSIGGWMNKLKKMSANLQAEVREVMDDPTMQPLRELGEFAAQPKKKLAEYALAAEAEVDRADAAAVPSPDDDPAAETESLEAADAPDGAEARVEPAAVKDPGAPEPAVATEPGLTPEAEIAAVEAEMETVAAETETEMAAAEERGEVVRKVVQTGPNHPMERQSPEPHALES